MPDIGVVQIMSSGTNSESWQGVAFVVCGTSLAAPLEQVGSIITCGTVTSVPLTKPWVRGVIHNNGKLLTLLDLPCYLGREEREVTPDTSVMLLNNEHLQCALLVERVVGLREFGRLIEEEDKSLLVEELRTLVETVFIQDDRIWGIANLGVLLEQEEFLRIGNLQAN